MKSVLILISIISLGLSETSCQFLRLKPKPVILPSVAPVELQTAIADNEAGRFAIAEKKLDRFLKDNASTRWTQLAELHQGIAFQGLDDCPNALIHFRHVNEAAEKVEGVQVRSFYQTSFCWETRGDEVRAVAALNDTWRRRQALPPIEREAELPARMASLYARAGNFDEADRYFRIAEAGLTKVRSELKTQNPDWYAKALYTMGKIPLSSVTWDDYLFAVRPLPRTQTYLLRAMATHHAYFAGRSVADLMNIYRRLVEVVEMRSTNGDVVIARDEQREQWLRASEIFELIREARNLMLVLRVNSSALVQVLDNSELRLTKIISQRPAGEGLTPAASERKRLMRGKTIEPAPLGEK